MVRPPRRMVLIASTAALITACSAPPKQAAPPVRTWQITGIVKRLYPERQTALIEHETIEGWMEAMTMEFPVRDRTEFAKLAEDRKITATLHVQDLDYWLTDIKDAGQ